MKKVWPWIFGLALLFLLVGVTFLLGAGLFRTRSMPMDWVEARNEGLRYNLWQHHGRGMRLGFRGLPFLGLLGGLLMLAFPLGILALIFLGIILLVRALQRPAKSQTGAVISQCNNCGKPKQSDWQICPYCGESLGGV
jgi:ribosomal protein L32